jgi:hypothetical protein
MSLINDALKRAKQAQGDASPPPPELHLRPVEPSPYRRHGLSLMLPLSLGVVALFVLLLVWLSSRDSAPVRARQAEPAPVADNARPEPLTVEVSPQAQLAGTNSSAQAAATSTNNPATVNPPEPEKPAPLKLQGIIFNPRSPSTVISGKTLFAGDRIRDFKVTSITRDSVTLVSPDQKLVLSLDQ